ncbi:MAG: ATP-binding cassette domain-containing protein, partial [Propionibacteriaceae bacterium]|nr:ATP-binding cassette domain-containing protein [Propionibacteriaceae bacterium]
MTAPAVARAMAVLALRDVAVRATAVLALRDVAVRHHGSADWAPRGVSFRPQPGAVTVVTGPTGCGKSNLAWLMAGLIPHAVDAVYTGSALLADVEMADADHALVASTAAVVAQDPDAQILTGSVADEIAYALENLRRPAGDIRRRTAEALAVCGLGGLAGRDPWTLSGGQRQRLALACGVAAGASLVILDEPAANIDPAGRQSVYALLRRLADRGQTVVAVETRLDDAVAVADRLVVLDAAGAVVADGPPAAVLYDGGASLAGALDPPAFVGLARALAEAGLDVGRPLSAGQLDAALAARGGSGAGTGDAAPDMAALAAAVYLPGWRRPDPAAGQAGGGEPDVAPAVYAPDGRRPTLAAGQAGGGEPDVAARAAAVYAPSWWRPAPAAGQAGGGEPLLTLAGVSVGPAARPRLAAADLSLRGGSVHAVVGANGAGKTTLLAAVAGAAPVRSGRLAFWLAGGRPTGRRGSVSASFQNPESQFTQPTVAAEFETACRHGAADGPLDSAERGRLLADHGLAGRANINPFALSAGEKRRLSIVQALAANRPVLLLDEPTAGLDAAGRAALAADLTRHAARGGAVLVATHDLDLVASRADRVTVMADGRVLATAPTAAVFARPELFDEAGLPRPPSFLAALAVAGCDGTGTEGEWCGGVKAGSRWADGPGASRQEDEETSSATARAETDGGRNGSGRSGVGGPLWRRRVDPARGGGRVRRRGVGELLWRGRVDPVRGGGRVRRRGAGESLWRGRVDSARG